MLKVTNILKLNKCSASIFFAKSKSTLVIVEHDNSSLNPITLNALTAAKKIPKNETITCLVMGSDCGKVVTDVSKQLDGVNSVIVSDNANNKGFMPEVLAKIIVNLQKKHNFTHILAGSSAFGKNLLPRVSALLDVQPISDVIGINSENTFMRTIYAGNAIQTVKANDSVKIFTVRGEFLKSLKKA
jgi:electron transfer flavoprotein alpha subunit